MDKTTIDEVSSILLSLDEETMLAALSRLAEKISPELLEEIEDVILFELGKKSAVRPFDDFMREWKNKHNL